MNQAYSTAEQGIEAIYCLRLNGGFTPALYSDPINDELGILLALGTTSSDM
ncbi:hypothetical protein N9514_02145 [Pseudomonadales bacterium]|nr:hypothetical protein [Pseudomonadales bacterium]MDB4068818.1 hypothetical protein [Pseudomonadales bacterium]MDC1368407.1 hypothetical protein [Pseudomonadales bacterium]